MPQNFRSVTDTNRNKVFLHSIIKKKFQIKLTNKKLLYEKNETV